MEKLEKKETIYLCIIPNKLNTMPWIYGRGTEPAFLQSHYASVLEGTPIFCQ